MIGDKEATMDAYRDLLVSEFEKLKKKHDSGQNLTNDEIRYLASTVGGR
jgi:hypothetical protein